jgi:hypothetical protein
VFGIFKAGNSSKHHNGATLCYDQAVIVCATLSGENELGTEAEHDFVANLEELLQPLLGHREHIDGHEFGENTATIYLYGPSADQLFAHIKDMLVTQKRSSTKVTLQYGLPDDPKTSDKTVVL